MTDPQLPTPITPTERLLTAAEFHRLAEVPPEIEWFANIRNRSTRRAYENAILLAVVVRLGAHVISPARRCWCWWTKS